MWFNRPDPSVGILVSCSYKLCHYDHLFGFYVINKYKPFLPILITLYFVYVLAYKNNYEVNPSHVKCPFKITKSWAPVHYTIRC